jgi:hypothetical protein
MNVKIAMYQLSVGSDIEPRLIGKDLDLSDLWGRWLAPRPTPHSLNLTFRCGISEQLSIFVNSSAFARTGRITIKLPASGRDVETGAGMVEFGP